VRRIALLLVLALLPACTPHFLRPLDYAPPPEARELYHLSRAHDVRYDGHKTLRAPDGEVRHPQYAGDLETRARSLAPPAGRDEPTVELVTVAAFGTRDYFAALNKVVEQAHPDVVVAAVPVHGDEEELRPDKSTPQGKAQEALYRVQRELLAVFPDLVFSRDALEADARFLKPMLGPKDLEFLEKEGLLEIDEEEFREAIDALRDASEYFGKDVMLHNVMDAFVEAGGADGSQAREPVVMKPDTVLPEPAFDLGASFESEVAKARRIEDEDERKNALRLAFATHRISEATLETMDLSAARGARRIVLLCETRTVLAISARLVARGYGVTRDRWLLAIPILSRPR
jgi:hypothetical protein